MGFHEYEGRIMRINGARDNLLSLVQGRRSDEIDLKIYNAKNQEFTLVGEIDNIGQSHPDFVESLIVSYEMQGSGLILDEKNFTRVYTSRDCG